VSVHETMESKCSCGAICIFARGLQFRQKYLFFFFLNFSYARCFVNIFRVNFAFFGMSGRLKQ
jgi:hypothetical protein